VRLRDLASRIAGGDDTAPRWIFLIGGPGNGKSEAVQDFVERLDLNLDSGGALVAAVRQRFGVGKLLPRRVDITGGDVGASGSRFGPTIRRLTLIQDASASDNAIADAADLLVEDVADLVTSSERELPVFVCCANRGLLARALARAHNEYPGSPVVEALDQIIRATALGLEALSENQPTCWPLAADPRFTCWPLDVESLTTRGDGRMPIREIVLSATAVEKWEVDGRCNDCDSRRLCPMRENAESLRDEAVSDALFRILRRGELATGQRWSFRDAFSLTAELIVGQWSDFDSYPDPCSWVHDLVSRYRNSANNAQRATAIIPLARGLYSQRLFQTLAAEEELRVVRSEASNAGATVTRAVCDTIRRTEPDSSKHIRILLRGVHRLWIDPARWCGDSENDLLKRIENEFGQGCRQGLDEFKEQLSELGQSFIQMLACAEEEWDVLGREKQSAVTAIECLRRLSSAVVKRIIGVRAGRHANEGLLSEYEESLRDQSRLSRIAQLVANLLGGNQFAGSLVSSFGQAETRMTQSVIIVGPRSGIRPRPAPGTRPGRPAYDMPCIEVGDSVLPLTFELYVALRRRSDGCANGSLPSGVAAMLERLRHGYAAGLSRDKERLADGQVWVEFRESGREIGRLVLDYNGELEFRREA